MHAQSSPAAKTTATKNGDGRTNERVFLLEGAEWPISRPGIVFSGAGIAALGAYGFIAALQEDNDFGRILAAYGGIFVAGSLAWGIVVDGFRPDRWDYVGALVCLVGVSLIMFAPRGA